MRVETDCGVIARVGRQNGPSGGAEAYRDPRPYLPLADRKMAIGLVGRRKNLSSREERVGERKVETESEPQTSKSSSVSCVRSKICAGSRYGVDSYIVGVEQAETPSDTGGLTLYPQVSEMESEDNRTIPGSLPKLDEPACESPPLELATALQQGVGRHTSLLDPIRRGSCEGKSLGMGTPMRFVGDDR